MQFSAVPFVVQKELTINKSIVLISAWQPPPLYALMGTRNKNPQEQVLLIVHEMPLSIYPWINSINKQQLEEFHLQKFCSDYCIAKGQRPYTEISPGNNPPDFVVVNDQGKRAVDCSQFAVESRRMAYGLFQALKQAVFSTDPSRFSHLSGLLVYVWIHIGKFSMELPLKKTDHDEFIQQLVSYHFVPGTGQVSGMELPQKAPDLGIESTKSGWSFYATPILISAPSSFFFTRMGFEMAFIFNTEHTAAEAWREFNRLVKKHDIDNIEDLIITVGAPDQHGYVYPAEETILDLMLTTMPSLTLPSKLSRIYVHAWGTGRIIQFFPETQVISQGHFTTLIPPHQPLTVK
jgi:hypothetical protein